MKPHPKRWSLLSSLHILRMDSMLDWASIKAPEALVRGREDARSRQMYVQRSKSTPLLGRQKSNLVRWRQFVGPFSGNRLASLLMDALTHGQQTEKQGEGRLRESWAPCIRPPIISALPKCFVHEAGKRAGPTRPDHHRTPGAVGFCASEVWREAFHRTRAKGRDLLPRKHESKCHCLVRVLTSTIRRLPIPGRLSAGQMSSEDDYRICTITIDSSCHDC
jgi:hypothetical protein